MRRIRILLAFLCAAIGLEAAPAWAAGCIIIHVRNSIDGEVEPSSLFLPPAAYVRPIPLIVYLHTWGGQYRETVAPAMKKFCEESEIAVLIPNYRGPNDRLEACASEVARQDIYDAIDELGARIDRSAIYLMGVSGGGHMALMLLGDRPKLFAGAAVWVPVVDLATWFEECRMKSIHDAHYKSMARFLGDPIQKQEVYRERSPLFQMGPELAGLPISIHVGLRDRVIPFTHGVMAFNKLAEINQMPEARVDGKELEFLGELNKSGRNFGFALPTDSESSFPVWMERRAGPARLVVFEGGHQGNWLGSMQWIRQQIEARPAEGRVHVP